MLFLFLLSVAALAQAPAKAPSVALRELDGHIFQLTDYKGKVVLINFWATWCPPCRTEIPELIKWQREYKDRGLQVIGVTYPPETVSEVRRFARRVKVNYPVALGSKATRLMFTPGETLPITVVIDAEGNVRDVIEGIVFPEEFDQKIKPLLANSAQPATQKNVSVLRKMPRIQKASHTTFSRSRARRTSEGEP